jgi:uncharacterized protein (TIGR00255 family)
MIQSMTGFGSAEGNGCRVEIRSLNHRFLEVYIKAPAFLNQSEILFRNLLKKRFNRGKIDVNITITEDAGTDFKINTVFLKGFFASFKKLQKDLKIPGELDINTLANLRDMFIEIRPKYDIDKTVEVFNQAINNLFEMRSREGEALSKELLVMTKILDSLNKKINDLSGKALTDTKEKFLERLNMIMEGREIDNSRILQEAAIFAAKLDISEEITRIASHISQFRNLLTQNEIIGRKLDFIVQELNREVNTIASKASDYNISGLAVDMKTELEKMREQVQNIQ